MPSAAFLAPVVMLSAFIQGLTGFGFGLTVVSVLVAVGNDVTSSSIMANITALFCQAPIMYRLRGQTAFRSVWTMLAGAVAAVPAGVYLLRHFGRTNWLPQIFGVFVLLVALWLLAAPRRPGVTPKPRRLWGLGAGVLSGVAQGMFNTGGPPAVLYTYSRPISVDAAKVTIQWLFTGMGLYRLAVLSATGMISGRLALRGLAVAPLVVLGALAGLWLAKRIHPDPLRKGVYALLVLVGLYLALK